MKRTLTSIIIAAALMTWGAGEALAQPGPALASMTLTVLTGSVPLVGSYNIYYGFLHNHSDLSDGTGTPTTAYEYAKNVSGLDFFSLSDHGSYLDTVEYQSVAAVADSYNEAGVFTAFWGFEWTHSTAYGHVTVINSPDHCDRSNTPTFEELMTWLDSRECIAFFNHPGRSAPAATEFDNFIGAYSDKMIGIELWNKGDLFNVFYYNSGYDTSDTTDRSGYFDEALLNGWQIGAAGSEDNHSGTWGDSNNRLAVLANANTRTDLYAALQARRFYSTLDKNLALSFEVDGHAMGSQIAGGSNTCVIEAADGDGETFFQIELIHNGDIVKTWSSSEFDPDPAHPLVNLSLTTGQGDYIYCKVTQADGDEAISSPVFVVIDGPPQAELIVPEDNGPDDLDPDDGEVTVNTIQSEFQIQLSDVGDGIDDATVTSAAVTLTEQETGSVDYTFGYNAGSDVITLAPTGGGDFGNGLYVITVSGIADLADPPNVMVATTLTIEIDTSIVPPETLSFQQGVDGYSAMVDTMIRSATGDDNYADSDTQYYEGYQWQYNADMDSSGGPSHVLMRFDGIIGTNVDQIPSGSTIVSATLRIRSTDDGDGGKLHLMLQEWVDTEVTWNNSFDSDGIQADDLEALSVEDDGVPSNSPDTDVDLDVTATVQAWADGAVNDGWAILPNGSNGWHMAAAEHPTLDYRPELIVDFITTGNRPPVADAGPDQTVGDSDGDNVETVMLDGSASSDPDGTIVSYEWDIDGDQMTDHTGETVLDVPLGVGMHTVTLTVEDNEGATDTDDVVITVNANQAPVADAGPDQTVTDLDQNGNETVTLDGSASSDPDGTIDTYEWKEGVTVLGTSAIITANLSVGTHTITLTVTDNGSATGTNDVVITVDPPGPTALFTDGFESGSFAAGGWTSGGDAIVGVTEVYSGSYGAQMRYSGWIEKAVNTTGFTDIHVKYARRTNRLDSGEDLYVEWSDGSSWHGLETTQDTSWLYQDMACGAGANDNPDFRVRFRIDADKVNEYAYVDEVQIIGTGAVAFHDVAVMAMTAPASVVAGDTATVDVTVENQGMFDETFDVTLTDTPPEGGTAGVVTDSPQTIFLGPGASTTVSFTWDTTGATLGDHTLDAAAAPVTGETDIEDNSMSTVVPVESAKTDIAITAISAPSSVVQGDVTNVDVTVENVGNQNVSSEIGVTLTDGIDGPTIGIQTISGGLAVGASRVLTYSWDTSGATIGDHTLVASQNFDDENASNDSMSTTSTITEAGATVHVQSIDITLQQAGKNYKGVATVLISQALSGASVLGNWHLGTAGTTDDTLIQEGAAGVTDGAGTAVIISVPKKAKSGEQFTFVVTNVVLSGYTYAPGDNMETQDSETVP